MTIALGKFTKDENDLFDILRLTLVEFVVDGETLNFHCHLEGL